MLGDSIHSLSVSAECDELFARVCSDTKMIIATSEKNPTLTAIGMYGLRVVENLKANAAKFPNIRPIQHIADKSCNNFLFILLFIFLSAHPPSLTVEARNFQTIKNFWLQPILAKNYFDYL